MTVNHAPLHLLSYWDTQVVTYKAVSCGCFMLAGVPIILSTLGCSFILILKSQWRCSASPALTHTWSSYHTWMILCFSFCYWSSQPNIQVFVFHIIRSSLSKHSPVTPPPLKTNLIHLAEIHIQWQLGPLPWVSAERLQPKVDLLHFLRGQTHPNWNSSVYRFV